jgi:selenocysteine lyase/cysteine desulfurase
MNYPTGLPLPQEVMKQVSAAFLYLDHDILGNQRLFFDNAGGSFRLKAVEEAFTRIDSIPDCPERNHQLARFLQDVQSKGESDIRLILNAPEGGSIISSLTASQVMFQMVGAIAEAAKGDNFVTTVLEHPSAFDAVEYYAKKTGRQLRVANSNPKTGGVDTEEILSLIDENTALLSVMYASNMTGAIYDMENIVRLARQKKPDIYIVCDAVQHAPHGVIDLEKTPVDAINFAPYKFFGYRGSGFGWVSERVACLPHHKLSGKAADVWELGSPAPAQYAAITAIVDYVCSLGSHFTTGDRRTLFTEGMTRIKLQERYLMHTLLEGTEEIPGLRHMKGVTVLLDSDDLSSKDFILPIAFDNIGYTEAVREYEKRNVIVYDRLASSIYSKRMLDSFGIPGAVRLSPLHCNTKEDICKFLQITQQIIQTYAK